MEQTPHEEIIALAKRYNKGLVPKRMIAKYAECIFNWHSFKISNIKGCDKILYTIMFAMSIVEYGRIIHQPKPKFKSGGIDIPGSVHGEEIIVNSKGNVIK